MTSLLIRFSTVAMTAGLTAVPGAAEPPQPCFPSRSLSTNQCITPLANPGAVLTELRPGLPEFPNYTAGGAITTVLSPDGSTLLVLTSGYNQLYDRNGRSESGSMEYIFVFGVEQSRPIQKQVLKVCNTFAGIAFGPDSRTFYVSGGKDDNIHIFTRLVSGLWKETGLIPLKHQSANGPGVSKMAAGLAVSGSTLVVANMNNDSISLIDLLHGTVQAEIDLRPGKQNLFRHGVPGGEYPFWVTIKNGGTAYISSWRDREIVVVDLGRRKVSDRISVTGNPTRMVLNQSQTVLYAVCDNSDLVYLIDTNSNRVVGNICTTAPEGLMSTLWRYHGSAPNSLCLAPDDKTLYVTNGGTNSLAIVRLIGPVPQVIGLIPAGFYPNSVSISPDGTELYVCNGRSATGPDPTSEKRETNDFILQLHHSSLLSMPVPDSGSLGRLTNQVAANNSFLRASDPRDETVMQQLRQRIQHIIYVIKENRSYDQILGDLDRGNGDAHLVEFGQAVTPNQHRLAQQFVDLDNFYDSADVSADGWPWSTSGRQIDWVSKTVPMLYAERGMSYDYEGNNRNINLAHSWLRRLMDWPPVFDPDILPGSANVAAPDGPAGAPMGTGHIWDAVLRAGLTVRNYGCFGDEILSPLNLYRLKVRVKLFQPADPALLHHTDCYYLGFKTDYEDYYREKEWEHEFEGFVRSGQLPTFEIVRLPQDHTDTNVTGIGGTHGPEMQVADNDYAVGCLVQKVADSPYKSNTLMFIVEDDAQNGEDHVDAHRSTAYIVGPYVKRGKVVSDPYTTINLVRTIEDILGLDHLNINTATQRPMTTCFDLRERDWTFKAKASSCLAASHLPIPASTDKPYHFARSAAYWRAKTAEFDFSVADHLSDPAKYNRIIWYGLKGDAPYPTTRNGRDLRKNRRALLRQAYGSADYK